MIDTPLELSESLQKTCGEVEITQQLYWHYLEVLPPRDFGSDWFIFQEGSGARLYFRKGFGKYYCHLLSNQFVTQDWRLYVEVSRKQVNRPFTVSSIFSDDVDCRESITLQGLVGKEYVSVSALAEELGVSFRV